MWREKASREIARMCFESWKFVNFNKQGKQYKRHRPYSVPELARELVDCLGNWDQTAGEKRAKQIFVWELG